MTASTGTTTLCTLRVGDEMFGFDIDGVHEVLGARTVHPVPLAPKFVAGVVAYRGEVLMVLSFRRLLGLGAREKPSNVVVLRDEHEGELFGLAVDSMGDVLQVKAGDFEENPMLPAGRSLATPGRFCKASDEIVIYLKPEQVRPMRLMELLGETAENDVCGL